MRVYSIVIVFILFLHPAARAFDIMPEYQGFSEAELVRFEKPAVLDSEYQTDSNAYTFPFQWDQNWDKRARALDYTVGSLTNQHFLQHARGQFETSLLDNLSVKFVYLTQRDREIDQVRHVFELTQKLSPQVAVAAYGEPSHYKRENDLGFAVIVQPWALWRNRFFMTFHDFTRSAHNDQADRFAEGKDPNSFGWVGAWESESSLAGSPRFWSRYGIRYDQPVEWIRPQEQKLFLYSKKLAFADFSWKLNHESAVSLRAQWDHLLKGQIPLTGSSPTTRESWLRERQIVRLAYSKGTDDDPYWWETALMHAHRSWINEVAAKIMHGNILPSAMVRLRGPRRAGGFDHLQFGVEVTSFNAWGDFSLSAPDQKRSSTEGRLQTAYDFHFKNDASLMLAFNFDLDEWATVPTFEGGHARFKATF